MLCLDTHVDGSLSLCCVWTGALTARSVCSGLCLDRHVDGSLKFWDASAATLQVLYKLKTTRLFDKQKCRDTDDDPFAVHHIHFCCDTRQLCVAGVAHVIFFRFSKQETNADCQVLCASVAFI